jgi:hypothetical protein
MITIVQEGAQAYKQGDCALRQNAEQAAMKPCAQAKRAPGGEGNVVARDENFFKSIALLEFADGRVALVAVVEVAIGDAINAALGAALDSFGKHGVGGSLVAMAEFGRELQNGCNLVAIDNFEKANHLGAQKGADKIAAFDEGRVVEFDLLKRFHVMRVAASLAHRRVIVDINDAANQFVVEGQDFYFDAALLGAPNIFACNLGQAFPPLLITMQGNGRDAFLLVKVGEAGCGGGRLLGKSEDVGAAAKRGGALGGIIDFLYRPLFVMDLSHFDPSAGDHDDMSAGVDGGHSDPSSLDADFDKIIFHRLMILLRESSTALADE